MMHLQCSDNNRHTLLEASMLNEIHGSQVQKQRIGTGYYLSVSYSCFDPFTETKYLPACELSLLTPHSWLSLILPHWKNVASSCLRHQMKRLYQCQTPGLYLFAASQDP